ncbi:MAG: hypothetical protein ACNA7V_14700 [Bacteroidales bacterium]
MEIINEIITNWYLVLFLISAGVALAVWARASKRKTRLDIDQATELMLKRQVKKQRMGLSTR